MPRKDFTAVSQHHSNWTFRIAGKMGELGMLLGAKRHIHIANEATNIAREP